MKKIYLRPIVEIEDCELDIMANPTANSTYINNNDGELTPGGEASGQEGDAKESPFSFDEDEEIFSINYY